MKREEIQPRLNELLKELKEVFEEHGLRYSLHGGTLLGAAVYKGFIPWDDDIDIGMPRPDYNKLIELAKEGKLKNTLHCLELNKKYKYLFAKYCDDKTYVVEKLSAAGNFGLWVDIFPLDGLGNTFEESEALLKRLKWTSNLYWATITPMHIRWLFLIPPLTPLFFMWRFWFNRLNREALSRDYESHKYVGRLSGSIKKKQIKDRAKYYENMIMMPFEDTEYAAPEKYHDWLVQEYTEKYLIPQPEHERKIHNYKAYEILESKPQEEQK